MLEYHNSELDRTFMIPDGPDFKVGKYEHYKKKDYIVWGQSKKGSVLGNYVLFGEALEKAKPDNKVRVYFNPENQDFILDGDLPENLEYIIYQAQYVHPEFGENTIWLRTKEDFFGTTRIGLTHDSKFKYL